MTKLTIELLPTTSFLSPLDSFDKERALIESGRIAGVCYAEEGYEYLKLEELVKTNKRVEDTLRREHHSVYDHANVSLYIKNIPKALAMVLNNEGQYNTSEKSGRYTQITEASVGQLQKEVYDRWVDIFKVKIDNQYGHQLSKFKIKTLAQENARYLVTVFTLTEMVYTVPLAQLNRLLGFMDEFIKGSNHQEFESKLIPYMEQFIAECKRLNVFEERLQSNNKHRGFKLLANDLVENYFGDTYSTHYPASFAQLAQVSRHRTLKYSMVLDEELPIYIPPIIQDNPKLVEKWLNDYDDSRTEFLQGQLVWVNEMGTYDDFILKAKERLCTHVQLESQQQTIANLKKYRDALVKKHHPLENDIINYTKGARCTFNDFTCVEDCHFSEGKRLVRKI